MSFRNWLVRSANWVRKNDNIIFGYRRSGPEVGETVVPAPNFGRKSLNEIKRVPPGVMAFIWAW
jgi:hypothetical protein